MKGIIENRTEGVHGGMELQAEALASPGWAGMALMMEWRDKRNIVKDDQVPINKL